MNKVLLTRINFVFLIAGTTLLIFIRDKTILLLLSLVILAASLYLDKKNKLTGRLLPLLLVSAFILLFQLIFNSSLAIPDRLIQGLVTAMKIFSLSMLVFLFTTVNSVKQITDALSFLPRKMQLAAIITLSLIPTIFEESEKILMVQNTRGHNSRSINIAKSFLPFIIPLLHRTLRRAEQIAVCMESRGYDEG